jgi:hypothetical protein
MLEEFWEILLSRWGVLGLGAALVISRQGRKFVRTAAKGALKAGICVSDACRELVAEVKEQGSDLVAEVQSERREAAEEHLKPAEHHHAARKPRKAD